MISFDVAPWRRRALLGAARLRTIQPTRSGSNKSQKIVGAKRRIFCDEKRRIF